MTAASCVARTELPELKLLARGKVRDVYEVDDKSLLFVATDRLSAFDVVCTQAQLRFSTASMFGHYS